MMGVVSSVLEGDVFLQKFVMSYQQCTCGGWTLLEDVSQGLEPVTVAKVIVDHGEDMGGRSRALQQHF
ncbi:hypothetical protein E2C01_030646 [Portunus trituberculatus]|uniref:Uncharacterized protein n=1 Tax=Portunus trituberculatus TaxID=210409 RepID=A0A5B7ESI7_PORTR|nr:hypothetical protein [Portunus trituberculatus]